MTTTGPQTREAFIRHTLAPSGRIPRLWCPPITHYAEGGHIDIARMAAHWQTMIAHVGGFLVPGSTGEAWDMAPDEVAELLAVVIDLATQLETRLLIGALRPTADEMHDVIDEALAALRAATGEDNALTAMQQSRVAAFTICPPRGAELDAAQIEAGLASVLDRGLPTAIYQLPQVTQNEIAPATFAKLAAAYPNFVLFKDTSGTDRVPLDDRGTGGVMLVRGAEGDYAKWLREGGGPYDGFLLSTANGFARELGQVIALLEAEDDADAHRLSQRLNDVVTAAFAAAAEVPYANAFANANKAIDHLMAYGPDGVNVAPPLLHGGVRLPQGVIRTVAALLAEADLLPTRGYLTP